MKVNRVLLEFVVTYLSLGWYSLSLGLFSLSLFCLWGGWNVG